MESDSVHVNSQLFNTHSELAVFYIFVVNLSSLQCRWSYALE